LRLSETINVSNLHLIQSQILYAIVISDETYKKELKKVILTSSNKFIEKTEGLWRVNFR